MSEDVFIPVSNVSYKPDVLAKYEKCLRYFKRAEFKELLEASLEALKVGDYDLAETILDKIPSREELYCALLEKLKTKSVYRSIKKIQEGKEVDKNTCLKGLLSLATHVVIEAKDKPEYYMLLPDIYEKIGNLIYRE